MIILDLMIYYSLHVNAAAAATHTSYNEKERALIWWYNEKWNCELCLASAFLCSYIIYYGCYTYDDVSNGLADNCLKIHENLYKEC